MEPVSRLQPLGAAGDLRVRRRLAHCRDVDMALGVVAEVVPPVEDPAGHLGVLVEPVADGEDGDPGVGTFRLGEHGPGDGRVTLAVEGQRYAGATAGAVVDLDRLPGKRCAAGAECGGRALASLVPVVCAGAPAGVSAEVFVEVPTAPCPSVHPAARALTRAAPAPARSALRRCTDVSEAFMSRTVGAQCQEDKN